MFPSVGYWINKVGLHPLQEKVMVVKEAPNPQNTSELKSYLGLLTYYSKFLPNMDNTIALLYWLLRKDMHWKWTEVEKKASKAPKDLLTSDSVLVHFNPDLLMYDASTYGVGSVLTHCMPDGSEQPIGYAFRSLTVA